MLVSFPRLQEIRVFTGTERGWAQAQILLVLMVYTKTWSEMSLEPSLCMCNMQTQTQHFQMQLLHLNLKLVTIKNMLKLSASDERRCGRFYFKAFLKFTDMSR